MLHLISLKCRISLVNTSAACNLYVITFHEKACGWLYCIISSAILEHMVRLPAKPRGHNHLPACWNMSISLVKQASGYLIGRLKYCCIAPPCVHKWTYICEAVVVAPQCRLLLTSIFAHKSNASQNDHNVYSKQSEEVHLLIWEMSNMQFLNNLTEECMEAC